MQRYKCPLCKKYVDVNLMHVDRKDAIVTCEECGNVFNRRYVEFVDDDG